jgi:hypothetical protein
MGGIIVVIGFIILVTGHQSGWLFVGGIGFLLGSLLAERLEIVRNEVELIIFSLTSAVLGGLLVAYLRKLMVIVAAFISGGYICLYLPEAMGWDTNWINWVYVLLAALASGLMTLIWGSLPVILISSVVGATLIVQNLQLGSIGPTGLFIVLVMFGLVSQWILWQYSRPDTE